MDSGKWILSLAFLFSYNYLPIPLCYCTHHFRISCSHNDHCQDCARTSCWTSQVPFLWRAVHRNYCDCIPYACCMSYAAHSLLPKKAFLGVQPFLFLWYFNVLWVACAPPWFFHRTQCFASTWCFLGLCLLNETIFFLEKSPPLHFSDSHQLPPCWLRRPFQCI